MRETTDNQEHRPNNTELTLELTHQDEIFLKETKSMLDLRALEEIDKNPKISQRELSNHLGVAVGITNVLLKKLAHKGLIKIRGNNNRTLTYHLTHAGVLAKSRLAMRWTLNTIEFYRQARRSIVERLADLAAKGVTSVVLYGIGELTEIAIIVAPEAGLKVVGIIDDQAQQDGSDRQILEYESMKLEELSNKEPDAVIVCVEIDDSDADTLGRYTHPKTRIYQLI